VRRAGGNRPVAVMVPSARPPACPLPDCLFCFLAPPPQPCAISTSFSPVSVVHRPLLLAQAPCAHLTPHAAPSLSASSHVHALLTPRLSLLAPWVSPLTGPPFQVSDKYPFPTASLTLDLRPPLTNTHTTTCRSSPHPALALSASDWLSHHALGL
jgi:hypothetical protein